MTIQEVNLYLPMFRKEVRAFSAVRIAQLTMIVLVGLLAFYAFGVYQGKHLEQDFDNLKDQAASIEQRLEQLRSSGKTKVSPTLTKQIEEATQKAESNKMILRLLAQRELAHSLGFAVKFESLANRHIPGMWLTEIRFESGGERVELSGWTQKAQTVPQYLQLISKGKEFEKVKFGVLKIEREVNEDYDALRFRIGKPEEDST